MAAQPKPLHIEQANYLEGGGIYGWLTTIDHKRVAVLYGITAIVFMMARRPRGDAHSGAADRAEQSPALGRRL